MSQCLAFSCPAISCPATWSVNFMSCIFMSCYLVRHFHVLQFHALQLGPSISCPAISCPSFSAPPFQQDSAPAHRARETIELLRRETRRTLFHRNSGHRTVQILTQWITKSGLQRSSASTRQRFEMLTNCNSVCSTFGAALNKTSSTHSVTSGMCH